VTWVSVLDSADVTVGFADGLIVMTWVTLDSVDLGVGCDGLPCSLC
jgi:hypothetical protein